MPTHSSAYLMAERQIKDQMANAARLRALRLSSPIPPRVKAKSNTAWLDDIRAVLRKIGRPVVTARELYSYAEDLGKLHPENNRIEEQIRHQMQELRNRGEVFFNDNHGTYTCLALESRA